MRRVATPMLDVGLFRLPQFSGALTVNLLSVVALTGFLFFVTQHLQLVEGLAVLDAALVLVPGVIAMIVAGLLVVRIVRAVDPGVVVVVALGSSLAAYGMLAVLGEQVSVAGIAVSFALLGVGIGAAETISNDLILSAVPTAKAGAASALSETAYEFGAVLGTTLLGGLLTAVYRATLVVPATIICTAFSAADYRSYAEQGVPFLAGVLEHRALTMVDLPTGHWPMWSKPAELAQAIHDAARAS